MVFPRRMLGELQRRIKSREIVLLTGMRRVGKTTLYRMLFESIENPNKVFLDIENPLEQKLFEEADYNNIWANLAVYGISPQKRSYIFLDEIQAYPPIVKALKYLYDHYPVKFFLTGSSSYYLKNLFPESLAGRKHILELSPLDFQEFLKFRGFQHPTPPPLSGKAKKKNRVAYERVHKLYSEYLRFGGFPEVVLASTHQQKQEKLSDIVKSYFEKDVRTLADIRNWSAFRDLLLLLVDRVGSKLDISKLASQIGISRETVYGYLNFLGATFVVSLIPPYSRNQDREVSGAKKVYVCDTGLLQHLARIDDGRVLENAVFLELRRFGELRYYQRRSGGEIDFILPRKRIAIEVKTRGVESDYRMLAVRARALRMKEWYVVSDSFVENRGFILACDL